MTIGPVAVAAFEPIQMYQGIAVPPSVMLIMPFASVGHVVDAVGRSGGVFPPEAVVPLLEPEPLPEPDEWEPLEPEPLPELDDCVPPEPEPPPELVEGEPLLEFPPLEFPPLEDPPFVEPSDPPQTGSRLFNATSSTMNIPIVDANSIVAGIQGTLHSVNPHAPAIESLAICATA